MLAIKLKKNIKFHKHYKRVQTWASLPVQVCMSCIDHRVHPSGGAVPAQQLRCWHRQHRWWYTVIAAHNRKPKKKGNCVGFGTRGKCINLAIAKGVTIWQDFHEPRANLKNEDSPTMKTMTMLSTGNKRERERVMMVPRTNLVKCGK